MFWKTTSLAGLLLLAGVVVLATPDLSQAQHGGRGGGGHFGGFHGGFHHVQPRFHQPRFNHVQPRFNHVQPHMGVFPRGMHHGMFPQGHHFNQPFNHRGFRPYTGSYMGSNGNYNSGASPYASAGSPVGGSTYDDTPDDYQAYYPAADVVPVDTPAQVIVQVPADAQLWFNGVATTATGPVRYFDTPPLTPGTDYSYEVQARWTENGREVTQSQWIAVAPGGQVHVDFPVPSAVSALNR